MSGRMGEWSLKLPYEEKPIRLQPSMIFVGRTECDIVVNSTTVDKRHAVIYFNQQDQQFHIKDLNTLSGTYVNGTRIPEQSYVKLEHGDQIRFGYHKQNYEMQLVSDDMPTPTTPMDDDDSLNESKMNNVSPVKGMDSLEDVSANHVRTAKDRNHGPTAKELHKNNSVPQLMSPTSPHSEGTCVPPNDLPLKNMVSSYCAPVRSPSEPQIDNRMVASLWDSQDKSPTKHKTPTRRPPAVAMVIPADVTDNGQRSSIQKVKTTNSFEESNGHEKAKAFVINFDEPKRRASIPQSVLQRRDQAARNKEDDCRVSEDSSGTNGNLTDSANFLIQKMLQSNEGINAETEDDAREGPADEDDHRSETGTYTVDDPQAREARRKIDMVFGVEEEAFNEYNARNKNRNKNKHVVPITRTQPIVAPPRRNRTTSSSTFLASSVPTSSNMMSDSMISSTISSGSSTGGLPSKPSSIRSKPVAITSRQNRRPSSSGVTRPPTGKSPTAATPTKEALRPNTAKTPTATATTTSTSTLRRGPYGGSDFSLESSNSSGSHLTGGESMKVNRAFALRRARLGLQDNVASQKSHLLTGSNPNLFSRQDGGRFSMRLLSSKQRTRPGMENPQHGSSVAGVPNRNSASPKTCRRNESDPCNINLLGQELDDADDLSRPEIRSHPHGLDPLSQSTFEPSTQGHDVLMKDSEMCRSASFNAHPRAASPLLLRKETFLKQKTSPQHQALETERQRAAAVASSRTNLGGNRPSSRTASPSRAAFSPQLQRRTLGSPQVARKVLPSPQASPFRQQQQQQQHQQNHYQQQFSHQPFQQAKASLGEKDEPQGLSALDQLVIQAISQLSGKLRLRVGSLMERESKRYPEGSDQSLLITELLSGAVAPPPAVTESVDISKELSGILRNLRNIETSVNTLLALEPAPPVVEFVKKTPSPQTEEAKELPDAETLGDTVPRGFFTVAL